MKRCVDGAQLRGGGLVCSVVSLFLALNADWSSGVERCQLAMEFVRVRRSEGSQDTSTSDMEARRSHVQQVCRKENDLGVIAYTDTCTWCYCLHRHVYMNAHAEHFRYGTC
jgi:hypothetical protein